MTDVLDRLRAADVLEPLDVHFARALERMSPGQTDAVLIGAALTSRAVSHGHVCLDLRRVLARPLLDGEGRPVDVELPSLFEWVLQLGGSTVVSDGARPTPLVFDGQARVYFTRYFRYQQRLAESLAERAHVRAADLDPEATRHSIERLFTLPDGSLADVRQRLAAAVALCRGLAVISGGPGTGKTTTVVRVLALLIERALARGETPPRIVLLAPTGKAAARLQESITAGKARLDTSAEVLAAIPSHAATIHRRLGFRPGSPTRFAHDADNPLPADVVLVDEASMVDLALMAKLFDAVPPNCRVILLGDKDQLASVEAGAILGDICNTTGAYAYSRSFRDELARLVPDALPELSELSELGAAPREETGIWDCIVHLSRSYRFDASSAIGNLARAIGQGDASRMLACLRDDERAKLVHLRESEHLPAVLGPAVLAAFDPYLRADSPAGRLEALGRYRLLSAHRRGPFGTERLNAFVERLLAAHGRLRANDDRWGPWYAGRPIIVTQNDYQLDLYNGDVGVIDYDERGDLRAFFPGETSLRSFLPARLPPHESVWAMTVHKSQGSEFDGIGLLLPPELSPILTRELVYTGLTRAKQSAVLYGTPEVLREAIGRRIDRASGLRDLLWGT